MRKTLSALALVLALLPLCVLAAHAEPLAMPDPLEVYDSMSFDKNLDLKRCYMRYYQVEDTAEVPTVVLAYLEELMQYEQLVYSECTTDPDGLIYHCFKPAPGHAYQTIAFSSGDWKTKPFCAAMIYQPNNRKIGFVFCRDFTLWDNRDDSKNQVLPPRISIRNVTDLSYAEYIYQLELQNKNQNSAQNHSQNNPSHDSGNDDRRCISCNGTGSRNCLSCNGSGWFDCGGCYNGTVQTSDGGHKTCSSCGGKGERRCSSCGGNGTKSCTMCGGDGIK